MRFMLLNSCETHILLRSMGWAALKGHQGRTMGLFNGISIGP